MAMNDARIDPGASIGAVHLTVADLERSVAFYRDALGFQAHATGQGAARVGAGANDLLGLVEVPGARRRARATGLFHFAVLLPSRADLARFLARVVRGGVRLGGASDHGVSEALYLADPDGNGIEVYRDRPRQEWPRGPDGLPLLVTDPLDLDELMREAGAAGASKASGGASGELPRDTRIGHVHLHVANLPEAERLYVGVLGFEVMARYGGEAVFVGAGGYHHHIGLNTWAGVGAPAPPPGSAGLRWFEIRHSSREELERTAARVRNAGIPLDREEEGYRIEDPSGNGIRLAAGAGVGIGSGGGVIEGA